MIKFKNIALFLCFSIFLLPSCSELEPTLYGDVDGKDFFENDNAFISALGSAYTNLYGVMNHGTLFSLAETSSDEACIPHRGPDWEDGGQWLRMHRHDFNAGEGVFGNVWNFAFGGINACNRLMAIFEESDNESKALFISELKVLRAYYYMVLIDVFGNVPLVTSFDVPEDFKPATVSRAEVFAFIEKELKDNLDNLPKAVDATTYGRMHYYVAQAMLSNLYLNAESYIGTPRYADAIAASDEIINSQKYNMESNYFANFSPNNETSKEAIFPIPYDGVFAQGFNLLQMTLHYESQKTFGLIEQPWNGYCSIADFYNSFEETDVRITGGSSRSYGVLLAGPQFDAAGNRLVDGADTWYDDTDGRDINFNPELNQLAPAAHRDGGARLSKYEYKSGSNSSMDNDFMIYRYTEILLNKAEALYRINAGDQDALDILNLVRVRAGVDPFDALNDDNFLAERGREMCFEAKRRTDLIRFNRWGQAWWEKPASEDFKKIMPIPAGQITLNPNLVQNPGY